VAKEQSKADILWIVDDSGSMEDDQMAVSAAAAAMADVLRSAQVDYRLGVARMWAQDENDPRRGNLEGDGFTRDLDRFGRDIVVGAQGGWEPGLETGILAVDELLPATAAEEPRKLRVDAAHVVVYLSDERDQTVECAACGGCDAREGEQFFCTGAGGQQVIDEMIAEYTSRGLVAFALVGDLPNGCQQGAGMMRDDFEPGQGYVEIANATGGQFGSLCGDMRQNVENIARGATGVASAYQLSALPASATIRVAIGPPGQGRPIPRSRDNGFDYDPVQNKIIFYGDSRPKKDDEVVVGYRRWDWANNPGSPPDACDACEVNTFCNPELDIALCQPICGDVVCDPGYACLPDTASCGDPNNLPPVGDDCGGCGAGLVCDASQGVCVTPCEQTGCAEGQICSASTHLCQIPNF
jgi:hypothetical protein